jgi:hypothetical protein
VGEGEHAKSVFSGYRVSVWKDEKVLEMDWNHAPNFSEL